MKTIKSHYLRARSFNIVTRLINVAGWTFRNQTVGGTVGIFELRKPGRRLIVTSPVTVL
jgi:hypothetical protein